MTDWFKKMTPEEAAKFRIKGSKFMIIPFTIIIIFVVVIVFLTVQKSSNKQKLADSVQNNSAFQTVCHKDLQQCGSGCIPSNAVCCDKTIGNSYCLWPDTLCKTNPITNGEKDRFICSNDGKVKSYDCSAGQVFCGMFCINVGEKCCFGEVCKDTSLINDSETDKNNVVVPKNSLDEKNNKGFVKIDSGECKIYEERTEGPYTTVFSLIVGSGSAAGQVGDEFWIGSNPIYGWSRNYRQVGLGITCSSWTKDPGSDSSLKCIREAGQPFTTDWTITLDGPVYLTENAIEIPVALEGHLIGTSQNEYLEFKCIADH